MAYIVEFAQPSDIASILKIIKAAFENDPIISHMKPGVPVDLEYAFLHESWLDRFATARLNGSMIYKAISDQG